MEVRIVLVFMKLLFYIFTMHDPFETQIFMCW